MSEFELELDLDMDDGSAVETTNVLEMILGPDYDDAEDFLDSDEDDFNSDDEDDFDTDDDDLNVGCVADNFDENESDEEEVEEENEEKDEDFTDEEHMDDEVSSVFDEFPEPGTWSPPEEPEHEENPEGLYPWGKFDPDTADMDHIIGEPERFLDNWHIQHTDYNCALNAAENLIEKIDGRFLDEMSLRDLAVEKGWLDINGTPYEHMGKMMEHFGLDVHYEAISDLDDLRECLENGGHPIAAVDADELWGGGDSEWFLPGRDANHAVHVIGMDDSDPDNPMVIINDSGVPDGAGVLIPGDLFMKAAEDSWMAAAEFGGNYGDSYMAVVYD